MLEFDILSRFKTNPEFRNYILEQHPQFVGSWIRIRILFWQIACLLTAFLIVANFITVTALSFESLVYICLFN